MRPEEVAMKFLWENKMTDWLTDWLYRKISLPIPWKDTFLFQGYAAAHKVVDNGEKRNRGIVKAD